MNTTSEDKLTIAELAGYLPYRLKMLEEGRELEHEMAGLEFDTRVILISQFGDYGSFDPNIDLSIKPILRPLSDLTKEIEHGGERFVPLVELAKLHDPFLPEPASFENEDWSDSTMKFVESNVYKLKYIVETSNMGSLVYEFSYWKENMRFALRDNTREKPLAVARQYQMFQKMFEWHFDLFSLLERGLAVAKE
jgi:hypothetical protein